MPFGSAGGPSGFPLIQNYADMAMDGSLTPVTGAVKSAVVARTGSTGCKHAGRLDSTPLGSSDRPRKVARSKHLTATADPLQFEASAEEPVFHTIPFRINGFVVPLEVDINALKRSLGLDLAPSDVPASGLDPTAHL
ncbi:unnamed protein product [Hyaloperonospora brassicae]|uniref:RxLR effector candidate protein n=1 Tax=Hyaloperonospora brassicae TaxID=162125 RepID=A0AAV0UDN2_HYABA|nr:unnamed protein product [Hyaloperonospora brassicae]